MTADVKARHALAMVSVLSLNCTTYEQVPPRVEARQVSAAGSASSAGAAPGRPDPRSSSTALSSDWAGTYSYVDKGPPLNSINPLVGYRLIVRSDHTARYEAAGYQTDTVVECDAVESGDSLVILVREMKPNALKEASIPSYTKGARLLILTRAKGKVATIWQEAKPAFDGCASGYVCFTRER